MSAKKEKIQAAAVTAPVLATAVVVEGETNTDAKETAFTAPLVVKDTARIVIGGMDYTNSLSSKIPDQYAPDNLLSNCRGYFTKVNSEAFEKLNFSYLETKDLVLLIDQNSTLRFNFDDIHLPTLRGRFRNPIPLDRSKPILMVINSNVEFSRLKGLNVIINCDECSVDFLDNSTIAFEEKDEEAFYYGPGRVVTGVRRIERTFIRNSPIKALEDHYSSICDTTIEKSEIKANSIYIENSHFGKCMITNTPNVRINNSRLTSINANGVGVRISSKSNEGKHPTLFIENKNWQYYPMEGNLSSSGTNNSPLIDIKSPFDILSIDFGTRNFSAVSVKTNNQNKPALLVFGSCDQIITIDDLEGPFSSNPKIRSIVTGHLRENENGDVNLVDREMMNGLKDILKSRLRLLDVVNSIIERL